MEIWKDIPGYDGEYQVSNKGRVKSFKSNNINGRILKVCINNWGYATTTLRVNGMSKFYKVHQLVTMAFLNHVPCGMKLVVNHINFDKTDNRLSNLEIITNRENTNKRHIKTSSKYIGVYLIDGKYRACIYFNKKLKYLGTFSTELEAHNVYQEENRRIFNS